jgi:hypothetical protein
MINSKQTGSNRKRGRQAGSVSFMQVSLKELNRILKPDAHVILSLKYAMLVGLEGKPVGGDMTVFEYAVNSGKADAVLETFDGAAPDAEVVDNEEVTEPKDLKKGADEDGDEYVPPLQADLQSWDEEDEPFN